MFGSFGVKEQAEWRISWGAGRMSIITWSNARLGNLISWHGDVQRWGSWGVIYRRIDVISSMQGIFVADAE
jgi:hypothetical protein